MRPRPLGAPERAAIAERTSQRFLSAVLLKPSSTVPEDSQPFRLAPLLMAESSPVGWSAGDSSNPRVYFSENRQVLKGREYVQMIYRWRRDLGSEARTGPAAWQGIRITLNGAGAPVVWEVLRDSSQAMVVFVAQSLETLAENEFGPALPGRRYAIESALAVAPEVVVARVIEDGPVPMGPIVHLTAAGGDVSSLICRCMTPQAGSLQDQREYDLVPESWELGDWGEWMSGGRPDLGLRLPAGF